MFHSPTQFLLAFYRTQLFNPEDIENFHALQDLYWVRSLSTYMTTLPPPPVPSLVRIRPIDVRRESESLQFFTILNAMLAYMPLTKEEAGLRGRLLRLGSCQVHHLNRWMKKPVTPISKECDRG